MSALPKVDTKFDIFPLVGGLDLHTPQLQLKPGVARAALNFECSINGGYTRIPGYERYDGRPSPSAATWTTLNVDDGSGLAAGNAIVGGTGGATAVVAQVDGNTIVITKVSGTFLVGENVLVSGVAQAEIQNLDQLITDQTTTATYGLSAANIYRSDIAVVPGSGPVRGGFVFNDHVYAFRDNVGGTACVLYQASSSGWTSVALPYEVGFNSGSVSPAENGTIIQGGVSAVVRRVVVTSGSFGTSNAAGKFIIDAPTGGNFVAGALTGGTGVAALTGAQTAVTLAPGGRFEIDIGDAGNGRRVYGTDGKNRLFEFDGTVFVPIDTGLTPDKPLHCKVHKHHIFVSMDTTAQHAAVGTPYIWSVVFGASALAVNEDITGFLVMPGNSQTAAMAIMSNTSVSILYGNGITSWQLAELKLGVGCKPYAGQTLAQTYLYDDTGVTALETSQTYGNFVPGSLTVNLRSFVQARRTLITDSLSNREKSQYRVFYSDGFALYATITNGQYLGAMPIQFPDPVHVAWAGDSANGTEISYFGSTNGCVYQLDTGTSFDGVSIPYSFDLSFASQGNARILKRYRKVAFEVQGVGYAEFLAGTTMGYGDELEVSTAVNQTLPVAMSTVFWDQFTWDKFVWDGRNILPALMDVIGTAENISMHIEGDSALWPSFTINSVALHYSPRRILR